jgi:ATP-binding cassette subfamily B protein
MSFWEKLFGASARRTSGPGEKPVSFKDNMKALRNLPPFMRLIWETDRFLASADILLRIFHAGLPLAKLYVGKLIIDEVIALAGKSGNMDDLWLWVGIEFALVLTGAFLSRMISLADALLGDLFSNETSVRLIEHAAKLDLPQFEDSEFYDKLERARRQTLGRTILLSMILQQAEDLITMAFLAVGLVVFNPWLILLLALAVVPLFLSETHFNKRSYSLVRGWTPERRELDYLRFVGASDKTAKEVKIFGLSDFLRDRFAKLADRYYKANRALAIRRAIWGFVFNGIGDAGYYVAYVVIILQTINGQISVGDLTFLAGSFNRLRSLLQGILSRFSSIAQSSLYLQDLFEFFDMQPEIRSPESPRPFPMPIKQGFTFENVSFKYPNSDRWAIRGVSFQLDAGEKLALVGENGAGKTTLVKLLARLYDPTEGRILLDGHDLREYDLYALRKAVGVIFQDFVRFDLKVSENIAAGNIEKLEEEDLIQEAARLSLADSVISKLPEGYEQMLGKRFRNGVELSGGEWQKVALGRAYMRDAQLLILDEPTAALDARAEYDVFQRFADLTKGKTAVLISHRFSTVRMADRILVLKDGQKTEIGSHEALILKDGLYAELFHLQAEGYR